MACLEGGCFLSNHSFTHPLTQKSSNYPPKFKYRASIASCCTHAILSVQNNPQSVSVAIPGTPNHVNHQTSMSISSENEGNDFLSFLNSFSANAQCPYDCRQIHGLLVKLGSLESDSSIGNKLAILYLRSGDSLVDARQVFDEIPHRTLPLYASLIGSYCRSKEWGKLFDVFGLICNDGMLPNKYLVPTILKACSAGQMLKCGKMVHGFVIRKELGTDIFVGNALIDLYVNCGVLRYSRNVFDMMQERDVVSWTALMSGYVDEGLLHDAEEVLRSMQLSGVKPDLIFWSALVSGSARIGEINLARHFMEEMQKEELNPNVSSWNGLISGCVHSGYFEDALNAFSMMLLCPEKPNFKTTASILPACASLEALDVGKAIHAYAIKSEIYRNIHVEGSLMDMYSKCGISDDAWKIFFKAKNKNTALYNEMISANVNQGKMGAARSLLKSMQLNGFCPDVITYNTLLTGYARKGKKSQAYALMAEMTRRNLKPNIITFNILITGFQQYGLSREALKVFKIMQSHSNDFVTRPDPVMITGILAACSDLSLLCHGKEIHGYFVKNFFEHNMFVSSALVDMYAKCNDSGSAAKLFWKMEVRNTVAWNSFITAKINKLQHDEALRLFSEMLCEGIEPSMVSFMILLPACGDIAALSEGRQLHGFMVKSRLFDHENSLVCALAEMYSRCKCISSAKLVSDSVAGMTKFHGGQ